MPFPNFIIGGPPKTGTTSLFSWLSGHPEVCVSSVKEPYFFQPNSDKEFSDNELAEYGRFFEHYSNEKILLEATPSNIYSASARATLHRLCPSIKVLFIMRNPAERLYSEYAFHKFKTKKFKSDFADFVTPERLLESNYSAHIDLWNATFGSGQIALASFDDLSIRPQKLMDALCDFLTIDPSFYTHYTFDTKNKTMALRNRNLHVLLLKWAKKLPLKWVKSLSPFYYKINSEATPPMSALDKQELVRLSSLFDQNLPDIQKKYASQFLLKTS